MAVWIVWEPGQTVAGVYDNPACALECVRAAPQRSVERFPVQHTYKGERPKTSPTPGSAIP